MKHQSGNLIHGIVKQLIRTHESKNGWNVNQRKNTLLYDGGHRYGNMITSMSKVLNSILKDGHALLVTSLV